MAKQGKFPQELRERAVRMVEERRQEHTSGWQATQSIAAKIGVHPVTLHEWVKRAEIDSGQRAGLSINERGRQKPLERENRELRRTNDMAHSDGHCHAYSHLGPFCGSEHDPRIQDQRLRRARLPGGCIPASQGADADDPTAFSSCAHTGLGANVECRVKSVATHAPDSTSAINPSGPAACVVIPAAPDYRIQC